MAYTVNDRDAMGRGVLTGTYTADGSGAVSIVTGLTTIIAAFTNATSASPNEVVLTATGGTLAISGAAASQTGYFLVIGL